jgi:hypothetical protein
MVRDPCRFLDDLPMERRRRSIYSLRRNGARISRPAEELSSHDQILCLYRGLAGFTVDAVHVACGGAGEPRRQTDGTKDK